MNNLEILLESAKEKISADPFLNETATNHRLGLHNMSNLNEAYFGGNKLFDQAEKIIDKVKEILDKYSSTNLISKTDFATCQELFNSVEQIFEEVFGVQKLLITLGKQQFANAFTYPIQSSYAQLLKPKKYTMYNGKYGIQFNPKFKVNVNMTVTLPLIKTCTSKEVLSIMIHEMGHNLNKNRSIPDKLILLPSQILLGWISDVLNSDKHIDKVREVRDDENASAFNKAKGSTSAKNSDFDLGATIKLQLEILLIKMIVALPIYKEERYSDSLAASYGYGEDIVTGLKKLYPGHASTKEYGPFFTILLGVFMTVDPHPERITRAKHVRDYIEYELNNNKDLTKLMREKLTMDKKAIDDIIKMDFTEDGSGAVGFRRSMKKIFGETDIRELFLKAKHGKIDKKTRRFRSLNEASLGEIFESTNTRMQDFLDNAEEKENLLEAFYDTNDNLLKVQAEFKKIINYLNKSDKKLTIENLHSKLSKTDYSFILAGINRIEEEFKDLFGLREMYIEVITEGLGAVATLSVQSSMGVYGKKLKVYQGDKAIKFNPSAGVNIIMFLGIENMLMMNERELTSVFLHEFGHNLNRSQTLPAKFWMKVPTLTKLIVSLILSDESVDSVKLQRNDNMNKKDAASTESKGLKKLIKALSDKFFVEPMTRFFLKNNAYREEKFSDAFAAMFGYGQDVHTALRKFDVYFTKKYGASARNKTYNRFQTYMEIMHQLSDPHPERVARIRSTINYIENELSNNGKTLSKRAKDILETDLVELKRIDNEDVTKGGVGNIALRQAIMKVTGGAVDIREITIKDNYSKIDKQMSNYDELKESAMVMDDLYDELNEGADAFGKAILSKSQVQELVNLVETNFDPGNIDI